MSKYCFPVFSAQTYVGRKRAAVDRICVGVPAGEVESQSSFAFRATTVYVFSTHVFSIHWLISQSDCQRGRKYEYVSFIISRDLLKYIYLLFCLSVFVAFLLLLIQVLCTSSHFMKANRVLTFKKLMLFITVSVLHVLDSSLSLIVFCPVSALVCWALMELERRRPSKCWLVTLMSAQGRRLWLVTGTSWSVWTLDNSDSTGKENLVYPNAVPDG